MEAIVFDLPTESEPVVVIQGDCRNVLASMPAGVVDAVVTDPPYGLGFMGKAWDHGVPGVEFWEAVGRVLKPGGCMLAMGGTRTYHRLACAVEDAGFEIRDCLSWLYGSGFPKGKGCLKPAWEPVILARKPGPRVLPLEIDACRVATEERFGGGAKMSSSGERIGTFGKYESDGFKNGNPAGRWPANVLHDGGHEVLEVFGESKSTGGVNAGALGKRIYNTGWSGKRVGGNAGGLGDTGTAARFFYCAKASKAERGDGNRHPTVKPLALVRYLVRLVCPVGGLVLDPFAGSGTTGRACQVEGRRCVLIEKESGYAELCRTRTREPSGSLFQVA